MNFRTEKRRADRRERDLLRLARRESNAGMAIWQRPWVLLAVVALMSLTDFSTLFSILDQLTVTSKYIGILIMASAALLLNLTPVLAAEALLRDRSSRWLAVVSGLGFLLLFSLQAYLRWSTRGILAAEENSVITFQADGASSQNLSAGVSGISSGISGIDGVSGVSGGVSGIGGASEISAGDTAMCIFLMVLPLCTSLVCFALAFLGKTPRQRAACDRQLLQQKRRNLAARIQGELEMLDAPEKQMAYLLQMEENRRKAALKQLQAEKAMSEAIAMEELAKAIAADGSQLDEITLTGQYGLYQGGTQ